MHGIFSKIISAIVINLILFMYNVVGVYGIYLNNIKIQIERMKMSNKISNVSRLK